MNTLQDHLLWEYEDNLPEEIDGKVYDALFPASKIIDGVRMFPYVILGDRRFYLAVVV